MEHQISTILSSLASTPLALSLQPNTFTTTVTTVTTVTTSAGSSKQVLENSKGVAKKAKKDVVKKTEKVGKELKQFIKDRPKVPVPVPVPVRRNPQRAPRVDYTEIVVPDDDHFLCE